MKMTPKGRAVLCLHIFIWIFLLTPVSLPANDFTEAKVLQVYDGDTIQVELESGGIEKVRLTGIDCPEARENEKFERDRGRDKHHTASDILVLGSMAKEFTEAACPRGATVSLEADIEKRDKYGRLLAYVWINQAPAKQAMLNSELLSAGLARTMTIPPNVKYADDFRKYQRQAREKHLGIWAK